MFTEKTVKITIQLQKGEFKSGGNTVTIEGLPVSVQVTKQGGEEKNKATAEIYNLKLDTIRQLTMLAFQRLETFNNVIVIEAGDKGGQLSKVFEGEITSSVPDVQDAGMVLKIDALAGYYGSLLPTPPVSVQGETTIESLVKKWADEAGYSFENKGITGSVRNCVFIGSPVIKARTLARQCGIDLLINDGAFTIQPYAAPKEGDIPLLNKDHGLLGYPSYSSSGIDCRSLFNPQFEVGGYFQLESVLPLATGQWQIVKVEHRLEAYRPQGGLWETSISGVLPDKG